jgi:endonuclease/exonuclease/phosphatase family metal-dependent hydrolase
MEKAATSNLIEEGAIEFGDIVPSQNADTNRSKLVVASYNIRYGVGRFLISTGLLRKTGLNPPQPRAEHVARNLGLAARAFASGLLLPSPDILALQEADKQTGRAGGHHIARELATELNMSWIHVTAGIPRGDAPKRRQWWLAFEEKIGLYDPGDTGIALLSRFSLEDVTRIDLPWKECAWRPRLSLGATVKVGPHRLRIFNSHIDPHSSADGQLDQLEVVLSHADKWQGPTVVLGDFNTLSRRKCIETRGLLESRGYSSPFPTGTGTWRGALIRLHADWIFVRDVKVGNWGVVRPLSVSDHWPIWVEVDLKE